MKIAIDLRSLTSGSISGVENYTLNLLDNLLTLDKKNSYILFYNSWNGKVAGDFHFINSHTKRTGIPNKILNIALKTNFVSLEKLIGPFDCLFMPNLNQFSISSSAKLAITVHDLSPMVTPEFYNTTRRIWHRFLNYKKAFARANVIFAVSEYTKHDIMRLCNIAENKIKVIYPGLDHAIFNPEISVESQRGARNKYSLPGDFILFLNTIEPRKNLSNLVKAFDLLDSDVHLVIAGRKGWKYRSIFNDIRKSKKFAKIHYRGYIPESEKPAFIKLARCLAYPSFYEGFGFQPLEAMACGVPVVVSQVTSLPEVVGEAAVLVNPYDVLSIASGLKQALQNDRLREMLIGKGLEQSKKFKWQYTAGKVLETFDTFN